MALSTSATSATTTTSFTSSPTAAVPILAFTTPFAQPPSCSVSSLLTTTVSYYSAYGTTTSSTRLLPDTSDPRYTACLAPAGSQFSFSPAVCPQGWPAWWLGRTAPALSGAATATATTPSAVGSVSYVSTAYCCAPGFSMLQPDTGDDPSPSCEQAFISTSSSSGQVLVSTSTLSKAMVPAWHISWQTTDMPTLSPRPPALDDGETITRWVPGSDPEREPRDNWGGGISHSLFYFLVVGIPLIVVAAVVACLIPACRGRRAKKRRGLTGAAS